MSDWSEGGRRVDVPYPRDVSFVCVEHPGLVKNDDKALETLGGTEQVAKVYGSHSKRLKLCWRPDDYYCKPTFADRSATTNILMKVKKRRRKSDGKEEYKIEILGRVETTYKYTSMCDFQYLPVRKKEDGSFEDLHDKIIIKDFLVEKEKYFAQDVPLFLPPISFSRVDRPCDFLYRQDIEHRQGYVNPDKTRPADLIGTVRERRSLFTIFVNFGEKLPTEPLPQALKKLEGEYVDIRGLELMREMFNQKPIWIKVEIEHKSGFSSDKLKVFLPALSFYWLDGPWRGQWNKFGFNPMQMFNQKPIWIKVEIEHKSGFSSDKLKVFLPALSFYWLDGPWRGQWNKFGFNSMQMFNQKPIWIKVEIEHKSGFSSDKLKVFLPALSFYWLDGPWRGQWNKFGFNPMQMFNQKPIWIKVEIEHKSGFSSDKLKVFLPALSFYWLDGPWRGQWNKFGFNPMQMFNQKPIWIKVEMEHKSGFSSDKLKVCLPALSFYWLDGPWRGQWNKFGFNPIQMFNQKPIWIKVEIEHKSGFSSDKLKVFLPALSFYWLDGPWRGQWNKFGFNPMKDTSAKIYQTLDFRLRSAKGSATDVKAKRSEFNIHTWSMLNRSQKHNVKINIDALGNKSGSKEEGIDREIFYKFKPGINPPQRMMYYPVNYIDIDEIQELIHSNDGKEKICTEKDGWCVRDFQNKCRDIMFKHLQGYESFAPAFWKSKCKSKRDPNKTILAFKLGEDKPSTIKEFDEEDIDEPSTSGIMDQDGDNGADDDDLDDENMDDENMDEENMDGENWEEEEGGEFPSVEND